jgi:hypothetical protein
LLFQKRKFHPWWFETATPTFLVEVLKERQTWLPDLGRIETSADLLSTFEVDNIPTEALMFQTGYLTIDTEEEISGTYFYRLRYPNREVYQSLNGALLRAWTRDTQAEVHNRKSLYRLLLANDFAGLEALFTACFASIPSDGTATIPSPATRATTPAFSTLTSPPWAWTSPWRTAPTRAG